MLLHGSQLIGTSVMSLQTGGELAQVESAIIDPATLKVVAYVVEGQTIDEHPSLLLVDDIRELSTIGIIIDSNDEFMASDDIIKLKPLYELEFSVIDKHVIDQDGKKLGKVIDYTIDIDSFVIQQLNVRRPLLKSLNDAELLIHRSQIVEINDTQIVVRSGKVKQKKTAVSKGHHYVNPFRQNSPQPQPESIDINQS